MAKTKAPTKQGEYEVGNKKPPKNRQFGQPEGNPRHNGAWKKEDTLRYKLQQIAKMTAEELQDLLNDDTAGEYEKNVARTVLEMVEMESERRWRVIEGLTNQDSGMPKQQVEQRNMEIKPILPKKEKHAKD